MWLPNHSLTGDGTAVGGAALSNFETAVVLDFFCKLFIQDLTSAGTSASEVTGIDAEVVVSPFFVRDVFFVLGVEEAWTETAVVAVVFWPAKYCHQ